MIPGVENGQLTFNIVPPVGSTITVRVYAVYHGRFLEMLLAHFDQDFSNVAVTALGTIGDIVK